LSDFNGRPAPRFMSALLEMVSTFGHAAPEQTRLDMVAWLRERYPRTRILALNPSYERLGTLRFNAVHYPPQAWLPLLEAALG
jgi:hypothetical protein